jgi:hypothetical protein
MNLAAQFGLPKHERTIQRLEESVIHTGRLLPALPGPHGIRIGEKQGRPFSTDGRMRFSRIQMRPKDYDGPMPPLERRIRRWSDRIGRGEPYLLRGSSLPPSFPELVPSRSLSPVSSVPSLTDLELIEDQIPAPPDVLMATAGPSRPPAMMASNDPRKRPGQAPAQPAPPKDINEDPTG